MMINKEFQSNLQELKKIRDRYEEVINSIDTTKANNHRYYDAYCYLSKGIAMLMDNEIFQCKGKMQPAEIKEVINFQKSLDKIKSICNEKLILLKGKKVLRHFMSIWIRIFGL